MRAAQPTSESPTSVARPSLRKALGSALFIPLKAKYFDAFERKEKTTEYRLRGPRWNARTCWIGRPVVLSRGYGKHRRLSGKIVGFHYDTLPEKIPNWIACYGPRAGVAACIAIALDPPNARAEARREQPKT